MRRWLVCLALLTLALGCAVARRAAPDEDTGGTSHPEVLPQPDVIAAADPTKRIELPLPPPVVEPAALDSAGMRELAKTDPVAFLTQVVERYDREVKGYTCTLEKQERVKGKLRPVEVVDCSFRENPFSVRMDWQKGAGKALKTAYVKGENDGNLLVLPSILPKLVGVVTRSPDHPDAKATSRYPVTEFGIQVGTRRTLTSWKAAKERGELKVAFNGEKKLKQLNDRPVWELKRTGYVSPEPDSIAETESTFYFDVENWLQIGSYLTGEEGKLIGSYYFRNLELNPEFDEDTFTRAGLLKKK
jgi:hypothetical protein